MKDIFYADKRDMAKWGGMIHLCNLKKIGTVIQVAYYRESSLPKLNFDGKMVDFPDEIKMHFRNIENISLLGKYAGVNIKVFKEPFSHETRNEYHERLIKNLNRYKNPKVVFLDPDNGLAPGTCKEEHVAPDEVKEIWDGLKKNDILVFYQHMYRRTGWDITSRDNLAKACRVIPNRVQQWSSEIAHDVVFFFIEK